MSDQDRLAWVKLYHPAGPQVTVPLMVGAPLTDVAIRGLFDDVTNLMAAGFSEEHPKLEEGEEKLAIRWLVRRSRVENDGNVVPILDLYADHEQMVFPCLTMYLNTEADHENLYAACGVTLDQLREYDGQGKLERGPRTEKWFARLQQPVNIIRKRNPKYNPEEADIKKRKPKYLFVRWDGIRPKEQTEQPANGKPAQQQQPAAAPADPLQQLVANWQRRCAENTDPLIFDSLVAELYALPKQIQPACKQIVWERTKQLGIVWDTERRTFFVPAPVADSGDDQLPTDVTFN